MPDHIVAHSLGGQTSKTLPDLLGGNSEAILTLWGNINLRIQGKFIFSVIRRVVSRKLLSADRNT